MLLLMINNARAYQYHIKIIHKTTMSTHIGDVWLAPFTSSSVKPPVALTLAEVTSPFPSVDFAVEPTKLQQYI